MSICDDCAKYVAEVNAFRDNSIKNLCLLLDYIEQLGAIGGKFGNARVKIEDVEENQEESPRAWGGHEELFKLIRDAVQLDCNGTTDRTEQGDEVEVGGDFIDGYDYKDYLYIDNKLEEIFDDWVQSGRLEGS